jgi:DNA-binding NtrC family response regulator
MSSDAPLVEGLQPVRLQDARDRFERDYILQVLAKQRGNITRSAAILGLERSNLYRKMRAFGIRTPRQTESVRTPVTEGADTSISDPS